MEKEVSLINGVGETGQSTAKQQNSTLSYHIQKLTQNSLNTPM